MNLIVNLVGISHLIFAILVSMYGFVIKKNWFDKFYIYYNYLVFISWTLFDGECFVTYVVKKLENPNYVAGSESTDLSDMNMNFDKKIFRAFLDIFVTLNIVSIFLVNRRNNYISMPLNMILVVTYLIYSLFLRKFMDKKFYYQSGLNKIFGWFQFFMRIFVIYLLVLTLLHP
jgi:hypothetical protein